MAASRRSFLLRIDPPVLEAIQRWANDDLRSLNGQIEFLLRRALTQSGRAPARIVVDAATPEGDASRDDVPPVDDDA
ncbi:hypothetical protein LuPra_04668 [Luteitalea pratensis]|uniref:Arc-like DNA binding domain-containing protein n=1 Tax=Luteitalea pratensis TaxID=1855912 RepID=A0A143PTD3_LUTPR|nr:hypothetical protein [Luteitalea pratensis]AMY11418.1 hypothetical protein LuPra_04668 [Luteitalea pratensis]